MFYSIKSFRCVSIRPSPLEFFAFDQIATLSNNIQFTELARTRCRASSYIVLISFHRFQRLVSIKFQFNSKYLFSTSALENELLISLIVDIRILSVNGQAFRQIHRLSTSGEGSASSDLSRFESADSGLGPIVRGTSVTCDRPLCRRSVEGLSTTARG